SKAEAEEMDRLEVSLRAALGAFNRLNALDRDWLKADTGIPIKRAFDATRWAVSMNPGGHSETKNQQFALALKYYFEKEAHLESGEKLQVSDNKDSPFVAIFGLCVGMSNTVASTTLARIL